MGRQSKLTESQRLELVLSLIRKDATGAELARRFGVSEAAMYRWRDEFIEAGKAGIKSKRSSEGGDELRQLKRELEEHKRVIGEYAFANEFLKKKLVSFP